MLFEEGITERHIALVERDKNRPSVIIWSLGNESGFGQAFVKGARYIRKRDNTRPIHYENLQAAHKKYYYTPYVDMVSMMYPSIETIKEKVLDNPKETRPFVMCEYTHAMGNSCGDIADYWKLIYENDQMMGAFVWEWADHATYLNCATLEYEHIPLKLDGYKIVLTNTNVKHSLGSSKYNERREECEKGLSALKCAMPNIEQLSDVNPEEFELHKELITDSTVQKRIKHVVYECDRVKKSAAALKNNDINKFGEFINQSHDSLQYDYEVTCPELDFVVKLGRTIEGVVGIRMTGSGFGGCTVAIIKDEYVNKFIEIIGSKYEKEFGHVASFYITATGNGGREI